MRKRNDGLQSLDRGLEILQLLAGRPYSAEELSRKLAAPRSTVYRTLITLRSRQLVERDPRQPQYTLGFGIVRLSRALLSRLPVREVALRTLRELAGSAQETAVLTIRSGDCGVAVETIESPDPVRVAPLPGERVPLHIGAPMKALLAFLPPEEIDAYLRRPLERMTPRTITDSRRLRQHLQQIRDRGYAESWEEVYPGAVGVAAPLVGAEGFAVASLGIAGPIHRFTPERVVSIAERLLPAAKELSRTLQTR